MSINEIKNAINPTSPLLLGRMAATLPRRPLEDETWLGIAPIGHRVTVSTPLLKHINVNAKIVLPFEVVLGNVETQLNEIAEQYMMECRQNVLDEWERTYFSNEGMRNAHHDVQARFNALYEKYNDPEILDLALFFPADKAVQTHAWYTRISRAVIGARLLESRLIADIDFESVLLNGLAQNLVIEQNQDVQEIPVLGTVVYEVVDYIA